MVDRSVRKYGTLQHAAYTPFYCFGSVQYQITTICGIAASETYIIVYFVHIHLCCSKHEARGGLILAVGRVRSKKKRSRKKKT